MSVPSDTLDFITSTTLGGSRLLVAEPAVPAVNLAQWVSSHTPWIDAMLLQHGGVLFRGFACTSVDAFEEIIRAANRPAFEYTYRSTPRRRVHGAIFSSTEYPPDQDIPMHNEMSYTTSWPRRLWFCCLQPAEVGGATPLADSAAVWRRIPEDIRRRFRELGVCYTRNYGTGLDLPWHEVFQTDDPAAVEEYCRNVGIDVTWRANGGLRTRQVCQSETVHPETGATVWFNQAHLFHVSALAPSVAAALSSMTAADDLPRHASFGDNSPIPDEALAAIRRAYAAATMQFEWRAGDVLLVDNVLLAHGRAPFQGARRVVVGMTA